MKVARETESKAAQTGPAPTPATEGHANGASRDAWVGYVHSLRAPVQPKAEGEVRPGALPEGGGRALPQAVQAKMEQSFGADLSGVRVHEGGAAGAMGAQALATGNDIHFAPGKYDPNSPQGQELLGHELAHVVQQRAGRVKAPAQAKSNSVVQDASLEREADVAGARAARGEPAGITGAGAARGGAVQLKTDDAPKAGDQQAAGDENAKKVDAAAADAKKMPNAGDTGMIDKKISAEVGGKKIDLDVGTVVVVKSAVDDKTLLVQVHSGQKGGEAKIPLDAFRNQPGLYVDEAKGYPEDLKYGQLGGGDKKAFPHEPVGEDVNQGYIGDCYLMAAMMAVAASNPAKIREAVKWIGNKGGIDYYEVRFFQENRGGYTPVKLVVDYFLPVGQGGNLQYAQPEERAGGSKPLWPAILEKGWARFYKPSSKSGYEAIGHGAPTSVSMEALTGEQVKTQSTPAAPQAGKEDGLVDMFKKWKAAKKPATCATKGSLESSKVTGFTGSGVGPYTYTVLDKGGRPAELMKFSVMVVDATGSVGMANDDGQGKMTGSDVKEGKVDYAEGKVSLTYKDGKVPGATAKDEAAKKDPAGALRLDCSWEGQISADPKLWANHAYVFKDLIETDKGGGQKEYKIELLNPWGTYHPRAMTLEEYRQFFISAAGAPQA
jgi:hypothetical protein